VKQSRSWEGSRRKPRGSFQKEISPQRRAWYEHGQADALALGACRDRSAGLSLGDRRAYSHRQDRTSCLQVSAPAPHRCPNISSRSTTTTIGLLESSNPTHRSSAQVRRFSWAERSVVRLNCAKKGDRIVIIAGDLRARLARPEILRSRRKLVFRQCDSVQNTSLISKRLYGYRFKMKRFPAKRTIQCETNRPTNPEMLIRIKLSQTCCSNTKLPLWLNSREFLGQVTRTRIVLNLRTSLRD